MVPAHKREKASVYKQNKAYMETTKNKLNRMQSKIDMKFQPKKNCMETNVPHQERQDPEDLFVFCFYDVLLRRAAEAQMQTQLSMVMRQSQPKRKDLQCGRQDQQVPFFNERSLLKEDEGSLQRCNW